MAEIYVTASGTVGAPAADVYRYIADYRQHHPRFLPPAFSDFRVEQGGVGAGTVVSFRVTAGGSTRAHRDVVAEPEPGRVLTESNDAGKLTTFTVTPAGGGSQVKIETRWPTAGLRGLVERLLAPRLLRAIFVDELARLDRYARQQQAIEAGVAA